MAKQGIIVIAGVKKSFRFSNFFSTTAFTSLPYFGTYFLKAV
jgi:hypothetical protein